MSPDRASAPRAGSQVVQLIAQGQVGLPVDALADEESQLVGVLARGGDADDPLGGREELLLMLRAHYKSL